ncbi:MAG: ABC transporter substrate-binding protein [Thalassospira sp.]|uniref:heme/hemin ABC transporter substrate-binding protein n=1 Tax=Thalassospira sp. TaxID=1912094 RepID=UPI0032EE30ED
MQHRFIIFLIALTGFIGFGVPSFAADRPSRVITVGAPATEIVFALGAGSTVIATDTTSTRPEPVPDLPKVGYMRQLASEGIISLQPDLIVVVEKAGPDTVLLELDDLGIPILKLPSLDEMKNLPAAIALVGDALGRPDEAAALGRKVQDDILNLGGVSSGLRPSIVFLMAVGHGQPLSGGNHTTANEIIGLIGGENTMAAFDGYKPVSPEVIASDRSDYVLIAQSTIDGLGGLGGLKEHPILGLNKAVATGNVLSVSSSTILGFGPESASEIRQIAETLRQKEQGQ